MFRTISRRGKARNRHWRKKSRQQRLAGTGEGYLKTGVTGAVARKSNAVARAIGDFDYDERQLARHPSPR